MSSSSQTPVPSEIAAILDRAADHIDAVGWWRGELYDHRQAATRPLLQCSVCAIGAINVALHGEPTFKMRLAGEDVLDAHSVAAFVEQRLKVDDEIATWNDRPGRTQGEVTAALRETAAELRAQVTA